MSLSIFFVIVLTFLINLITTLSYSVRIVGHAVSLANGGRFNGIKRNG